MTFIETRLEPPVNAAEDVGKVAVEAGGSIQAGSSPLVETLSQDSASDELDKTLRQALSVSIRRLHERPDETDRKLKFTNDAIRYLNADPLEPNNPNNLLPKVG